MPMCDGKRRYDSAAQAKRHLHLIWKHARGHKLPQRFYRCPECRGWHLTSKDFNG